MTARTMAHHTFIYLASQSPRRRQLLGQIGVQHQLLLPAEDEDAEALEHTRAGDTLHVGSRQLTRAKLGAARLRVARRALPPAPILCADTTVALGTRILGKPVDARDARATLSALSGRTHRVLTAVAVWTGRQTLQALSVSHVRFAKMPASVIDAYVASGEPFGKAGAYAIQSALAGCIERIEGSHSSIMGLPLYETAQLLQRVGVRMALAPLGA
jgi:septum formation protein